jgi:hypothetical protein
MILGHIQGVGRERKCGFFKIRKKKKPLKVFFVVGGGGGEGKKRWQISSIIIR